MIFNKDIFLVNQEFYGRSSLLGVQHIVYKAKNYQTAQHIRFK